MHWGTFSCCGRSALRFTRMSVRLYYFCSLLKQLQVPQQFLDACCCVVQIQCDAHWRHWSAFHILPMKLGYRMYVYSNVWQQRKLLYYHGHNIKAQPELKNWWVMGHHLATHDPCDPSHFRDPFDPWPIDPFPALMHAALNCVGNIPHDNDLLNSSVINVFYHTQRRNPEFQSEMKNFQDTHTKRYRTFIQRYDTIR